MKSVCITGVGGYLGLATAHSLLDRGYLVFGIDTFKERPSDLPKEVVYGQIDILDTVSLVNFFKENHIEVVYHFAGIKYVGKCEQDPELCFSVNKDGTASVLRAMEEASVKKIIYSSTYAVYSWGDDILNLTEESLLGPQTVYGKSKLEAEHLIEESYNKKNISEYCILRYGNIIGCSDNVPLRTVQSFIDKLVFSSRTTESVVLNGSDFNTKDGTVARDFIDVRDVVNVNLHALQDRETGVYNISSGSATTLLEIIQIINEQTGKDIRHSFALRQEGDPSSIIVDSTKAYQVFKWQPEFSITETLRQLITHAQY